MHSLEVFKKAQAFFQEHREGLLKEYEGKYIAIVADQVVDADEDFSTLAERVYAQYGESQVYMPKVTREQHEVHIASPIMESETSKVNKERGQTMESQPKLNMLTQAELIRQATKTKRPMVPPPAFPGKPLSSYLDEVRE